MGRRSRLVVVAASVAAAVVGSIVLAAHRPSYKPRSPLASALPPGGKIVARIRIGRVPSQSARAGGALAVGEGAVWAVSASHSALMRIDPARNAVVARIPVPLPDSLAAGEGAVWLTDPFQNTVSRLDPATNTVTATIRVGPRPEGIAVSPGAVWVVNADGPTLARIDPATNRVVATIRLGRKRTCCAEHTSVIASPRAVWVALTNGNRIVHVDPATNRVVASAHTGYQPCGSLAADETAVWSAGACGGDVVARIDSDTHEVTATLAELHPVGLAVAFGSVWVAVAGSGNIDQVDPHTARVVARLHIVGLPIRLGADFGSVWVNDDLGRVLRIDPQR
jgi:YVTN family beta-propeller protein